MLLDLPLDSISRWPPSCTHLPCDGEYFHAASKPTFRSSSLPATFGSLPGTAAVAFAVAVPAPDTSICSFAAATNLNAFPPSSGKSSGTAPASAPSSIIVSPPLNVQVYFSDWPNGTGASSAVVRFASGGSTTSKLTVCHPDSSPLPAIAFTFN